MIKRTSCIDRKRFDLIAQEVDAVKELKKENESLRQRIEVLEKE